MRFPLLIPALLFSLLTCAQPHGKLYFFTGSGGIPTPYLGYLEYPAASFHFVDSIQLSDVAMVENILYAAAYLDVVVYDTATDEPVDTITNVYARHLAAWDDKLTLASIALPYFRVYDGQHQFLFALDSVKVPESPTDLVVSGDTAFLLFSNYIIAVDLIAQDTIATVPTPHPYVNQDFNTFLVDAGSDLYIDVEYATGAMRFSLMRMNKTTFDVDTVFHDEGHANFAEPVVAGDKIYLLPFDSHYDINLDSLFISSNPWWPQTVEYDGESGALFLNNDPGNKITYFLNGNFSDTASVLGNIAKTLFVPEGEDTVNAVPAITTIQRFYPNPAGDYVQIEFGKEMDIQRIEFYNASGMLLQVSEVMSTAKMIELKTATLPEGVYFVKILTAANSLSAKLVKLLNR